jgi:hypothetical protein
MNGHSDRTPLAPIVERASRAADAERPHAPAVHAGVAAGDWLVLSGDDTRSGDRGRWIASDTTVDAVARS